MQEENNFEKVYEKEAPDSLKERSLKNAQGSVSTMRSFFSVLDLYISKFFGAILHSLTDNTSVSANTGFAYGMEKEDPTEEKEAENNEDDNEEDWYSDDDIPDDLIKS